MRLLGVLVLCCLLSGVLGCSSVLTGGIDVKVKEVEEYNTLVKGTLDYYVDIKKFAESKKSVLLEVVVGRKSLEESGLGGKIEDSLSKDEVSSFQDHVIVHDDFYTSLGASHLREIMILISGDKRMIVNVLWGKTELMYLERVVSNNE